MPTFAYRALDGRKRSQQGRVWAPTESKARQILQERGLQHIFLRPPKPWERWLERWQPSSGREQALCCRQLAVMLQAGIPLVSALEILLRQPLHPGLYQAYAQVCEQVHQGAALSKALRSCRGTFDDLYIGLVQLGERTGTLADNLEQVANHLERELALQAKVRGALTYPLVVTLVSLAVAYFIVQHLLPRFINGLFREANVALPWYTQLLVKTTNLLQRPDASLVLLGTLGAVAWMAGRHLRTQAGQIQLYEALLAWKPTRRFFGTVLAVRTARMLAVTVEAGLPIVAALELTSHSCANPYLSSYLEVAVEDLQDGHPLSRCLRAIPFLPPTLSAFVQLGEEVTGLPKVLQKAADLMELEVDEAIQTFTQLLEPLLVGVMGFFVGFVLIALFVPIYGMLGGV